MQSKYLCLILVFCLALAGCSKKDGASRPANAATAQAEAQGAAVEQAAETAERPTAESIGVPDGYNGLINEDNVRLRAEPNLESEILLRLNKNIWITVLGWNDEKVKINDFDFYWFKVRTGDFYGWVYGEYIDFQYANSDELEKQVNLTGYREYYELYPDAHIEDIAIDHNYIALTLYNPPYSDDMYSYFDTYDVNVYEYDKNICFSDYEIFGKKLFESGKFFSVLSVLLEDGLLGINISLGYHQRWASSAYIWNISEQKEIYKGYGKYRGNDIVEDALSYGGWDDESKRFEEEYVNNNEQPKDTNTLIIFFDYNLKTGEETNFRGKWVLEQ
jgi:hypothetical protein